MIKQLVTVQVNKMNILIATLVLVQLTFVLGLSQPPSCAVTYRQVREESMQEGVTVQLFLNKSRFDLQHPLRVEYSYQQNIVHSSNKTQVKISGFNASELWIPRTRLTTHLEVNFRSIINNTNFSVDLDLNQLDVTTEPWDMLFLRILNTDSRFQDDNVSHKTKVKINNIECYDATDCGISNFHESHENTPEDYPPESWPWLAAIMKRSNNGELQFLCAGNLISNIHVITAAQCMEKNGSVLHSQDLIINLGQFDLSSIENNPNSQSLQVAEIKINPEWLSTDKTDADLALLILDTAATFNSRVRPVCHSSGGSMIIQGPVEAVAGWNSNQVLPRTLSIQPVSKQSCRDIDSNLRRRRPICTSFYVENTWNVTRKVPTPATCKLNPGEALVSLKRVVGDEFRYYLDGVYSRSLNNPASPGDCGRYGVFSNMEEYLEWLLIENLGYMYMG